MKTKTKKRDWSDLWAILGGGTAAILLIGVFVAPFIFIKPDRSWCTNYPKAYSKAASAEYVDGIGCIVTDTTGEKMPYDSFDRKYYP